MVLSALRCQNSWSRDSRSLRRYIGRPHAAPARLPDGVDPLPYLSATVSHVQPLLFGIAPPLDLQKACEAALKTIKNLGDAVDTLYRRAEKLK
jgi:hypothetical protein